MFIFESTNQFFLEPVLNDTLTDEIEKIHHKRIGKPHEKEIPIWTDSILHLEKVLHSDSIPDDAVVAIEIGIPPVLKEKPPSKGAGGISRILSRSSSK